MAGKARVSPFEQIRHISDDDGDEFWSARELAKVLGYSQWRNFKYAIEKARVACENSGYDPEDHFAASSKMITTGKGAKREIEDWDLSRYACYLIVQNADPEKPIVALGQTYFAVRTRQAELAEELANLPERQRRMLLRDDVSRQNVQLAGTYSVVGEVTERDFAIFQDHGYMGLYNGERAKDIAARKGLKSRQKILDWMGSEELAANLFRITQTEAKLRREGITDKEEANRTHHEVGAAVRSFIIDDLGGTPPEQLPTPKESIQQLRRRERQRLELAGQLALFEDDEASN